MNNIALRCQSLSKSYHDGTSTINVLQEINLEVQTGEMISIVGTSGSGKSTLLHLLGGLDNPTAGSIEIGGKNLSSLSEIEKCQLRNQSLGFVYQFHHLLPEFTAEENVAMPLFIRNQEEPRKMKERAAHWLDSVGLSKRLHHKIGELSGGERQRVAIARALVTQPVCVLADEPTGNLDPRNAEKVLQLFIDLQKSCQTSVILVTHDHQIAKQTQRVLTLEHGKLNSNE